MSIQAQDRFSMSELEMLYRECYVIMHKKLREYSKTTLSHCDVDHIEIAEDIILEFAHKMYFNEWREDVLTAHITERAK